MSKDSKLLIRILAFGLLWIDGNTAIDIINYFRYDTGRSLMNLISEMISGLFILIFFTIYILKLRKS